MEKSKLDHTTNVETGFYDDGKTIQYKIKWEKNPNRIKKDESIKGNCRHFFLNGDIKCSGQVEKCISKEIVRKGLHVIFKGGDWKYYKNKEIKEIINHDIYDQIEEWNETGLKIKTEPRPFDVGNYLDSINLGIPKKKKLSGKSIIIYIIFLFILFYLLNF